MVVWPLATRRDIDPPRRADDGVGDLRIADIDLGCFRRQIDDHRFADPELEG